MSSNPQKISQRYTYGIRKIQLRYRGIAHQYTYGIGNTPQRYSYGIYGLLQRYSYGTPSIYTKGIGLWVLSSGSLVSADQLNVYQTPSASNNLERLARKSEIYIHVNPGRCHEQQEYEGIPENVTGLLETTNQRSNSQRNASCNCQQYNPSAGIKCNKHERVDQDDSQSNEGMNNAVSLDHILKMRVRIKNSNGVAPAAVNNLSRGESWAATKATRTDFYTNRLIPC